MYPYLLPEIFNNTLPMYDILIMLGIFIMLLYVSRRFEKTDGFSKKQTNQLLMFLVVSLVVALLSSYLIDGVFHFIKNYGTLHDSGLTFGEIVKESFGSITFLGGLLGGLSAFALLFKYKFEAKSNDFMKVMNTVLIGVVIAHAFGRLGCYSAGCCYGVPTESFLGVIFPHGHASHAFPGTKIFPTQLFESAFLFVLFILLNKVKSFKNKATEVYLIGYGVWRILIEFIRGDDRGSLFGFITTEYNIFPTPSQYISLGMIILGAIILSRRGKKSKLQE